jgi:hypothetical protein
MVDSNQDPNKLSRRKFFAVMAATPAAIFIPAIPDNKHQVQEPTIVESELSEEQRNHLAQIRALEAQLAANNGAFSWYIHNELRHSYRIFSQEKSLEHSDIILSHHVMDEYILNTLSDWHFHYERPQEGIAALLGLIETYGYFVHITAASLIKIGDVRRQYQMGDPSSLYSKVVELTENRRSSVASLNKYFYLARMRLGIV